MYEIKREMQKTATLETEYPNTQVSFNSDGCLTVRKYDIYNKDKDEIIIFNQDETKEIARLFKKFKELGGNLEDIPF